MRIFLIAICNFLIIIPPLWAQFSFEKIKDKDNFEYQRAVEFYWTPRYNRVEGLFLNGGLNYLPPLVPSLTLYGDVGAGFWNESDQRLRYTFGIKKDLTEFNTTTIGAELFRSLESQDEWIIGDVENSLASLFFREDYKDYYGSQGFKFFIEHQFLEIHTLRFEIGRKKYDSLRRNINWSVFGGNFSENPKRADSFIAEGDELGIKLAVAFDWRDNPLFPQTGWYVETIYEHTGDDFDTDGLFVTIKHFQQPFVNHRLILRGLVGTRQGSLAEQYRLDLGGIGSLRGFEDKEFTGNRLFMINANYFFGGTVLQKLPLHRVPVIGGFWTILSLGIFVDTGWTNLVNPDVGIFEGFGDFSLDDLQTNIGFSIIVLEGLFRMDVAKVTNRSDSNIRVTFRLLESL